jgi:hypothetical protein
LLARGCTDNWPSLFIWRRYSKRVDFVRSPRSRLHSRLCSVHGCRPSRALPAKMRNRGPFSRIQSAFN